MKKFSEFAPSIMLCSFVMWSGIFLCLLFPLFGLGLAFFAYCFLSVGLKKNILDYLQTNKIKVENVFDFFRYSLSSFCLQICTLFLVALWSLALFIPGIIAGVNYSFAPYIFAENPRLGVLECLEKSKEKTYGHRTEILLMCLVQVLIIVLVVMFSCCFVIILNYFASVPSWVFVTIPIVVSVFIYFVVVYPYFQIFMADLYQKVTVPKSKNKKNISSQPKSDAKVVA